jgi:BlaI family penicillinase repressor
MARKASAALTDGETRVMAVLWRLKTATVAEVLAGLKVQYALTYSTVQTTLRILEQKGYVAHEKVSRAFVFRPLVDERQARRRALQHLITRLFNGSPSLLVSNVLDDDDIDPAELQRLKKMIEHA